MRVLQCVVASWVVARLCMGVLQCVVARWVYESVAMCCCKVGVRECYSVARWVANWVYENVAVCCCKVGEFLALCEAVRMIQLLAGE